jgi:hypothetical protein
VCIWSQGGGGPKKIGNDWPRPWTGQYLCVMDIRSGLRTHYVHRGRDINPFNLHLLVLRTVAQMAVAPHVTQGREDSCWRDSSLDTRNGALIPKHEDTWQTHIRERDGEYADDS